MRSLGSSSRRAVPLRPDRRRAPCATPGSRQIRRAPARARPTRSCGYEPCPGPRRAPRTSADEAMRALVSEISQRTGAVRLRCIRILRSDRGASYDELQPECRDIELLVSLRTEQLALSVNALIGVARERGVLIIPSPHSTERRPPRAPVPARQTGAVPNPSLITIADDHRDHRGAGVRCALAAMSYLGSPRSMRRATMCRNRAPLDQK